MLKYTFREPTTFKGNTKADPQQIGEALALLAEQGGGQLTPHAVVDAAKNPESVLHRHFEWDNAKAAHSFRIDQARGVIRAIVCEDTQSEEAPLHAFLSLSTASGTSYRTIQAVRMSRNLQALVLKQAERELQTFERRYNELNDICALVREARELVIRRMDATESHAEARA